jgi:hypothetical protein
MWHNDKKVLMTFASNHSQNSWAQIEGVGWRKIKTGATDGVTNLYIMMCVAKANNRMVNVHIDTDNLIDIAYLK